jgi:hypothetical protein
MKYPKAWFEMQELRRRKLDAASWIPLRSSQSLLKVGNYGDEGNVEEFFAVHTLAAPLEHRDAVAKLRWMDLGISPSDKPYVDESGYSPADTYHLPDESGEAIHLVLQNSVSRPHHRDWIIHHDLILGFGLINEGNAWLSPDDGYEKVIEIHKDTDGKPLLVTIKSEYLKDFLAARQAALYVVSYRSRREIDKDVDFTRSESEWENASGVRWEGRVNAIHEGGMPFGEHTAVFHVAHKGFDTEQDVPVLPNPVHGEVESKRWTIEHRGRKLYVVHGELWKEEWIEPATSSPRIRGDKRSSTASFVIDGSGERLRGDALTDEGRWLWFRPDVIPALAHRRGGELCWYTRFTGGVSCVPSSQVHFGLNRIGLVTVYAKDIGYVPDWQQRIWAAYNVAPEGGVSEGLAAAQIEARPAHTQAPEPGIIEGLKSIRRFSSARFGTELIRTHDQISEILKRTHRFRAVDEQGLFALAKDLARLTADLFDVHELKAVLELKDDQKVGSLKGMEKVLAKDIGQEQAHALMGPLFGIYGLRLGDAHLPKSDQKAAFELAGVDRTLPLVHQGERLIACCVSTLFGIAQVLHKHLQENGGQQ